MNYEQIMRAVYAFADRTDAETVANAEIFVQAVEATINTALRVREMTMRATVELTDGQQYYGLPNDFGGVRDIEFYTTSKPSGERQTLHYLTPEQMNNAQTNVVGNFYTIVADQLQVYPANLGCSVEIVYYQIIPNLNNTHDTNWLSEMYPNAYIYGLVEQISLFVKDYESGQIWEGKFKEILSDIRYRDAVDRWSGSPLQVRNA